MKKSSLQGLAFRNDVEIDGDVISASISDSYKEFMSGAYSRVYGRLYRTVGCDPKEAADAFHLNVNETIDASVFDRWSAVAAYKPPSIKEWEDRKKIDPAFVHGSVRADLPSAVAPD
jgi:hypothetical protein